MITVISSDKSHNGPIMALDSDILTMYKQILIQRARKSKERVEEVELYSVFIGYFLCIACMGAFQIL